MSDLSVVASPRQVGLETLLGPYNLSEYFLKKTDEQTLTWHMCVEFTGCYRDDHYSYIQEVRKLIQKLVFEISC